MIFHIFIILYTLFSIFEVIERKKINNKDYLTGYHTQEFRSNCEPLEIPILCKGKNAWLGVGYYFWTELEYAHYWGKDFKLITGNYDIYKCFLNIENCINSVFDEKGYLFLKEKIEETINHFKDQKVHLSLEKVNRFLADNIWPGMNIDGIIYDDKPINTKNSNRIHSEIPDLYYKKRIQVVVFNVKNIRNFEIYLEAQI